MTRRVLITGSHGLIGTALRPALETAGFVVTGLDVAASGADRGDVRDRVRVGEAVDQVDGVVHLAAISRVVWGERDPETCRATNVGGLQNVIDHAAASPRAPWVLFSSSREVYGQPDRLPADEDVPAAPVNVYGRSKLDGERAIQAAIDAGHRAAIVRLSNVYGATRDHEDRVIPAFARAASAGGTLRVDGPANAFDFTHLDDTVRGLAAIVRELDLGRLPPTCQLVTGRPTTLGELARLALELADTRASITEAPPRDFDVARFWGDPSRADQVLGWRATTTLREGMQRLIDEFAAEAAATDSGRRDP